MILMIDNYDSFTYNLVQALRSLGREVRVVRNDEVTTEEIAAMDPEAIVLSPGPGNPDSAGVTLAAVKAFAGKVPMLGICLGHQSIAQAFGAKIVPAKSLMHGKTSRIRHDGKGLFAGLPQGFEAMRYHSLAVDRATLPDCFVVSAETEDGEIMGIRHRTLPIESLQYHPESIGTPEGIRQLRNFVLGAAPSAAAVPSRRAVPSPMSSAAENARRVMASLMRGEMSDAEIAALLNDYNARGVSEDVLVGSVLAMREAGVKVEAGVDAAVDIVGTGGDGHHTFNVSTAAAFVAAGAGAVVAKHGNVAATSKCGAADVLRALGYDLTLSPERVAQCIRELGIGFLFARELHPAMKYAANVRRQLGCKTVFNLLGPLTNPAGVRRHAIGVYDPKLAPLFAKVLRALGSERALIFSGENGLDEISPSGLTFVTELRDGVISSRLLDAGELYGESFPSDDLKGGSPAENAEQLRGVLSGRVGGARRAATVVNAAAALTVAGRAESLAEAVEQARASIDSGAALAKLEGLVRHG
ncbi:MAG: anthranilate phosphoribosyltransferase [Kiritimatiellia bacterium]